MIDSKLHRERASLAIYAGASRFLRAATFLFRRAAGSTIARRHFVIHERRADRFPVIKHLRRNSGGPRSVLGLPAASRSCISAAVGLGGQSPACCRSSVVEHSLGKGEVESSILSGSTSFSFINRAFLACRHGRRHGTETAQNDPQRRVVWAKCGSIRRRRSPAVLRANARPPKLLALFFFSTSGWRRHRSTGPRASTDLGLERRQIRSHGLHYVAEKQDRCGELVHLPAHLALEALRVTASNVTCEFARARHSILRVGGSFATILRPSRLFLDHGLVFLSMAVWQSPSYPRPRRDAVFSPPARPLPSHQSSGDFG